MRRTIPALLAVVATALLAAAPAPAAAAGTGWTPAPSAPWDRPAGNRCDFPVHGEPVVDEVEQRVLDRHPDGTLARVAYRGDLVVRVTNTATGAWYDADASGSAVVEYRADGSRRWYVLGPVLVGFGEDAGSLPRGLYLIDGVYRMDFGPTGHNTVTMAHGTVDDLCARVG